MLKKTIAVSSLPILLILMVCFSGCGKQDESAQEPEVKSYKIVKPASPPEGSAPPADGKAPGGAFDTLAKYGSSPQMTDASGKTAPGAPAASGALPLGPAPLTPMLALGSDIKTESDTATYSPAGRVDPFVPLFQAKSKGSAGGMRQQTIRDARKGKLTPLENLDISQMKLTAIIISPQQKMAMVQESTGKGHVIKKGSFIGINSGRVVDIRQNEVIIEEEVEDLLGKIIVRKRELKLQKPLGEM